MRANRNDFAALGFGLGTLARALGQNKMNPFQTILIVTAAFLAVFGEATLSFPRSLLGAQVDLLPALMVYAALNAGLPTIALYWRRLSARTNARSASSQ